MKSLSRLSLLVATVFLLQAFWIDIKAVVAQELIAHAWQQSQAKVKADKARDSATKPWPWADTWPVTKISFKGNSFYVLAGASGHALAFGPAHLSQSAAPGLGHTVIAAHKDTHFSTLAEVQSGDVIELENQQGQRFVFQVQQLEIVDSRKQGIALSDRKQLTLVTCYPFNTLNSAVFNGPLRLLVHAELIDSPPASAVQLASS